MVSEENYIAFLLEVGLVPISRHELGAVLDEISELLRFVKEEGECLYDSILAEDPLQSEGIRQTKGLPLMPPLPQSSIAPLLGAAVEAGSAESQPAFDYITSLDSENSRVAMRVKLDLVARLLGYASIEVAPWSALSARVITLVREHLLAFKRSPATVNQTITALKGVVREAWSIGLATDHTMLTMRLVKKVRGSRDPAGRALSESECARIFDSCDAEKESAYCALGKRDAAFFALGLGLGLRRAEIVTVKIVDLNASDRTLLVRGKGNVERRMPVPAAVWERLEAWLAVRGLEGSPYIITHAMNPRAGRALTRFTSTSIVKSRLKKAGVAYFSCHDLRRTYATSLYQIGHDILTVKEGLGHASVTTTQKYIRNDKAALRALASRLSIGAEILETK